MPDRAKRSVLDEDGRLSGCHERRQPIAEHTPGVSVSIHAREREPSAYELPDPGRSPTKPPFERRRDEKGVEEHLVTSHEREVGVACHQVARASHRLRIDEANEERQ